MRRSTGGPGQPASKTLLPGTSLKVEGHCWDSQGALPPVGAQGELRLVVVPLPEEVADEALRGCNGASCPSAARPRKSTPRAGGCLVPALSASSCCKSLRITCPGRLSVWKVSSALRERVSLSGRLSGFGVRPSTFHPVAHTWCQEPGAFTRGPHMSSGSTELSPQPAPQTHLLLSGASAPEPVQAPSGRSDGYIFHSQIINYAGCFINNND